MKSIGLVSLVCAAIGIVSLQPESFADSDVSTQSAKLAARVNFQGLGFGETRDQVIRKLAKFKIIAKEDNSIAFSGKFANSDAIVGAYFTHKSKKLYKVAVIFTSESTISYSELHGKWSKYCGILSSKYGGPSESREDFESGYELFDKKLVIGMNKSAIVNIWSLQNGQVSCFISKDCDIIISYENTEILATNEQEEAQSTMGDL